MPKYSGIWTLSQAAQAIKNQDWEGTPPTVVEYLVVAGGGGASAGGGGAGGLLQGYAGITRGSSYYVTVGAGGPGNTSDNASGQNSVFDAISSNASTGRIVALGGGQGSAAGSFSINSSGGAYNGGSGGGSWQGSTPGLGISGQGNGGGNAGASGGGSTAGGGGGAGTAGLNSTGNYVGANGGAGIASDITGTRITYAGGGAGGGYQSVGKGGAGGGGDAGYPGTPNTGGGGGGYHQDPSPSLTGAAGGSGIVVIRYPGNVQYFTGGTLNYSNGFIVHTFYSSGVLAPTTPRLFASPDYQISRSLRFYTSASDNPYVHLNRTPSTTGSTQRLTYSCWIKKSGSNDYQHFGLCAQTTAGGRDAIRFESNDVLGVYLGEGGAGFITSPNYFRDTTAWYHIVVAIDTTQQTSTDRIKIYVNGLQIPTTGTQPTQNYNFIGFNVSGQLHNIGKNTQGNFYPFNGYMAEVNFVDGQQLTPQSFGYVEPTTGVWTPLQYVGTYGTNGFYLNFADNSNTTAATLGKDSSGNGNNWTPNNFSVTAGTGNDSFVDTPTNYGVDTGAGGEVRGNYCTLNPLNAQLLTGSVTNGNLQFTGASGTSAYNVCGSTIAVSSNDTAGWYFETTVGSSGYCAIGLLDATFSAQNIDTYNPFGWTGSNANSGIAWRNDGVLYNYGTSVGSHPAFTTGDVIGIAIKNNKIWFAKNNTWIFGNPATETTPSITLASAKTLAPAFSAMQSVVLYLNCGQRSFSYAAPSGYKALCTQNLPESGAGKLPGKYFGIASYSADGGDQRPIVTGVDMATYGGLTWFKARNVTIDHFLADTVRGLTKFLAPNKTQIEYDYNFNGVPKPYGLDINSGSASLNQPLQGYNYVMWNWAAGGTATTNTAGSITSQVSANVQSGFSIVTLTIPNSAGSQTYGHGLDIAPAFIIAKNRGSASDWFVYHKSITGTTGDIRLNNTDGNIASGMTFNSTNLTTVTIGGSDVRGYWGGNTNWVFYNFAEIAGYSKFGSYVGNGSADGPFVYCGFRPAFILRKCSSTGGDWIIFDVARDTYNVASRRLNPNLSGAEATPGNNIDILSNGWKERATDGYSNASSQTFIFAAFAESPFKYARAR